MSPGTSGLGELGASATTSTTANTPKAFTQAVVEREKNKTENVTEDPKVLIGAFPVAQANRPQCF